MLSKLIITLLLVFEVAASYEDDKVVDLPGLPSQPSFDLYSGYLDGYTSGHKIHYTFAESQKDPANDPLVLWFNGGPGCSSMEGFVNGNGPFRLNGDGETLSENKFSWNKEANMLYFEAPTGVGFSYNEGTEDYSTNDTMTTSDNFEALSNFLERFPHLKKNEIYLTGESYSGIYVPLLTERLLNSDLNIKGYLIVNGMIDINANFASGVFYLYYHGMLPYSLFKDFANTCCKGTEVMKNCNVFEPLECREKFDGIDFGPLNMYNIYSPCILRQKFPTGKELSPLLCVDSSPLKHYFNKKEVQDALHVKLQADKKWNICNVEMNHKLYKKTYKSTESVIYNNAKKVRGYIINGDADLICNVLANEWSYDNIRPHVTEPRRPYTVNGQLAGYTKAAHNLRFVTVRGSGHMVPHDTPEIALRIFQNFLIDGDLSEK